MSKLLCLNTKLLHHVGSLTESCCETYLLLADRVIVIKQAVIRSRDLHPSQLSITCSSASFINSALYRGADKSLARLGRKQATATEDFDFHISYL